MHGDAKHGTPILNDRGGLLEFRKQVVVYANYYRFDKVFTSDPNVDEGSNDREPIAPRGIRGNV